jgi:NAD(P)H-quinone oxidoreductase subunit 2
MLEWFYNLPFVVTMNQMNLPLLAPELILLIVILFCLFQSIAKSHQERLDTWNTAILGLVLVMMSCLINFFGLYLPDVATGKLDWFNQSVAFGVFQADLFSLVVRFLLALGTLLTLLLTREYLEKRSKVPAEFYVIMLSALLGAMFMAGASDLIMLFVAIETLGIASYILVGFIRGNLASTEAALKYLLYGAAASACILFGFSLLYGVSGTTALNGIAQALVTHQLDALLTALSLALVVGGIGFKLSVAPFHNWAPDVYEGAPAPVTAFLSVVSKLAGFAVAIRLLYGVLRSGAWLSTGHFGHCPGLDGVG